MKSRLAREMMARRTITVHGDWHLWIYCCHWRVWQNDEEIAYSNSPNDRIDEACGISTGKSSIRVVRRRDSRPET